MSNAPKDATHYLPVKEGVRAEPGYWKKVGDDAFAWSMDGCWTWTGKDTLPAEEPSEGLRPVDTGDTSRPLFKVERW